MDRFKRALRAFRIVWKRGTFCNFAVSKELSLKDRSFYAKSLRDNPIYAEIFNMMKNEAITEWTLTPARDNDAREFYWNHIQILKKFDKKIRQLIGEAIIDEAIVEEVEEIPL